MTTLKINEIAAIDEILIKMIKDLNRQGLQHIGDLADVLNRSPVIRGTDITEDYLDLIECTVALIDMLLETREPIKSAVSIACETMVHAKGFLLIRDLEGYLRSDHRIERIYSSIEGTYVEFEREVNHYRTDLFDALVEISEASNQANVRPLGGQSHRRNNQRQGISGGIGGNSRHSNPSTPLRRSHRSDNDQDTLQRSRPVNNNAPAIREEVDTTPHAINFNWETDNYFGFNGYNGLPLTRPFVPFNEISVILNPKTNTLTVENKPMNRNDHQTQPMSRKRDDFDFSITLKKSDAGEIDVSSVSTDDDLVIDSNSIAVDTLDDAVYAESDVSKISVFDVKSKPKVFKNTKSIVMLSEFLEQSTSARDACEYIKKHSSRGFVRYIHETMRIKITSTLISLGVTARVTDIFLAVNETYGLSDADVKYLRSEFMELFTAIVKQIAELAKEEDGQLSIDEHALAYRVPATSSKLNLTSTAVSRLPYNSRGDGWIDAVAGEASSGSKGDVYLITDDVVYHVSVFSDKVVLLTPKGLIEAALVGGCSTFNPSKPKQTQQVECKPKESDGPGNIAVSATKRNVNGRVRKTITLG